MTSSNCTEIVVTTSELVFTEPHITGIIIYSNGDRYFFQQEKRGEWWAKVPNQPVEIVTAYLLDCCSNTVIEFREIPTLSCYHNYLPVLERK